MIDELRGIAIFVETIKSGPFKGAAEKLGLSPSVVSYHISQLEARLGNALIYRSTRKLSLTSEGATLLRYGEKILAEAILGKNLASSSCAVPSGVLKVSVPSALTRGPIADKIMAFSQSHPKISLWIDYTDERLDIIAEAYDLAIRVGDLPHSMLKMKQLGVLDRIAVCSPHYYKKQPEPTHLEDLAGWNWIKHDMVLDEGVFSKEG